MDEIPFDNARKRMTTVHRRGTELLRVICKGAPEVLLRNPSMLRDGAATVFRAARSRERRSTPPRASACSPSPPPIATLFLRTGRSPGETALEDGLRLLGMVAIADPPRASAAGGTIAACRRAGIAPVLITGDHPATAARR